MAIKSLKRKKINRSLSKTKISRKKSNKSSISKRNKISKKKSIK